MLRLALPFAAAAVLSACGSSPEPSEPTTAPTEHAAESPKAEEDDGEDMAAKLAEAELDLRSAEIAAEIDAMDRELKASRAEREVEAKRQAFERATRELEHFRSHEQKLRLDRSNLGLDRSRHRRELAADELGELEAMYAEEDLATKTKELVLKRGRKNLEFSQRDLEFDEREAAALTGFELPKQLEEKMLAVDKAKFEIHAAQVEQRKTELSNRVSEMKSKAAIKNARRKLEKLRAKAKQAK
ncbi:MAG: hypothetical protein KDB80_00555 [Planctomycetes bacterium]|nr:hypothetical protein [Planctomycetota bacterium]